MLESAEFDMGVEVLVLAALQAALKAIFISSTANQTETSAQLLLQIDSEARRMETAAGTPSAAFQLSATPNGRTRSMAASIFQPKIIESILR